MSWKTQGLYVWTTRKPTSFLGLPLWLLAVAGVLLAWALWLHGEPWWWIGFGLMVFKGRHVAYVGQTSSRYHRDRQHTLGDSHWGSGSASWSDLAPRVYPLPCAFPASRWAREVQEKLWILLLLPVYNTEWNGKNPRRVKSTKARQMRWTRQQTGMRVNVARTLARWALAGVLLAGLAYTAWPTW